MKDLLVIVGPTGIGKSRLALKLACTFDGEIVGADSRQIYRYMDIGTGKPTSGEMAEVPHHLIGFVNPDQPFSVAEYQALAYQSIADIQGRGKLPLLAGGSGLYVWTVMEGWRVPPVPPDTDFRRELENKAAEQGADALYKILLEADPGAAKLIDPHNVRRVIRALEVSRQAKRPFSQLREKLAPDYRPFIIGLTAGRTELYRRIDNRVDEMVRKGLVAEVEKLLKMGYSPDLPSMSGVGYRQVGQFLKRALSLEEAVRQTKFETHRVARHQYAWFRLSDERIQWFDVERRSDSDIEAAVSEFLHPG